MIIAFAIVCCLAALELAIIAFLLVWLKAANQEIRDHVEPVYPIDTDVFEEIKGDREW